MISSDISILWSKIITQHGLQTTIDLISNPPKILSSWVEGPTLKDGRRRFWYRKLLFSNSAFPEVVSVCEYFVSSRIEITYYDSSIPAEKQYESNLLEAQKKVDEKLKVAGYFFSDEK